MARMLRVCGDLAAGREPQVSFAGDDAVAFRRLARAHGLIGLAVRAVNNHSLVLPEGPLAGLRNDWQAARQWCSALDDECTRLGALVGELREHGLNAPMLIKGAGVARRYADPTLRTYVDFDLLVRVEDFDRWVVVLGKVGYRGPRPELTATRLRLQHSVALTRSGADGDLGCDLHTCLFVERRARRITHEVLEAHAEPSPFAGLSQPSLASQLVVLALHFVQHPPGDRRLIWTRDFIELATGESVHSARALAYEHEVGWAVEAALADVENLIGWPVWSARPSKAQPWGLARVHQHERPGYLHHLALVRELGPAAGVRYFASRVDPRRFPTIDDRIDWRAAIAWSAQTARKAIRTPWRSSWRR